jgi:hypothetical protein
LMVCRSLTSLHPDDRLDKSEKAVQVPRQRSSSHAAVRLMLCERAGSMTKNAKARHRAGLP